MGTVIQDKSQSNPERQSRWDRFERADLFAHYLELQAQGVSQRQAAKERQVPRTTLQAWRLWHDSLDICPHVAEFFQKGPGLAFLHRIVIAFHLVCVEVGACGIRLVCLFLNLTGLDRFVAASYGAQQQVNRRVEEAMVAYRQDETARLAQDMPLQMPDRELLKPRPALQTRYRLLPYTLPPIDRGLGVNLRLSVPNSSCRFKGNLLPWRSPSSAGSIPLNYRLKARSFFLTKEKARNYDVEPPQRILETQAPAWLEYRRADSTTFPAQSGTPRPENRADLSE